jgi:hypothetical protein
MILPNINYLYMYRPANEYTKKLFQDERLWSSKPKRFNDPFDCDLEATKDITEVDLMHAIRALHGPRENWPCEIAKYVESIFDNDGKFTPTERDPRTRA